MINHKQLFNNLVNDLYEKKQNLSFVQIGTMDGITNDNMYSHIINKKMRGVLVEPIPYWFNKLKETYKNINYVSFENAAVSLSNGETNMFYVNPEKVKNEKLPDWYNGHSSILYQHAPGNLWGIKGSSTQIKVNSINLDTLTKKHNIEDIDIYFSDCEGYDLDIIKQLDFNKFKPSIINIESNKLNHEDIKWFEETLKRNNYEYINFFFPSDGHSKNSNYTATQTYVKNTVNIHDDKIKKGIDWLAWNNEKIPVDFSNYIR